jgi:hypothetical protein
MGRPTKLTPEVQQRICTALSAGATYELAAKYGGVSYESLNAWRKSKPAFAAAADLAEGEAAVCWLAKIERAASDGGWRAAAWKLERGYPHVYGRTVQTQEQQGRHQIKVNFVNDWRGFAYGETVSSIVEGSDSDE